MIDPEDLSREFEAAYGRRPRIFRAPGRVNLIGEHTDNNDGYVMPMAIDRSTWVAAAPRADRTIVARSRERGDAPPIELDAIGLAAEAPSQVSANGGWSDYVRGVAAFVDRPGLTGADLLIASDVPIGGGLSSSAALEVACGYALLRLSGAPIDLTALALACQRAEHEFAGTRCGVMDQMIACHARADTLYKLDTRSLAGEWVPLPPDIRVVVCNTMVAHELASAEYNARRADCEAGVRTLAARFPAVRALRDATLDQLDAVSADMTARVLRRCRHVITENARVENAACALARRHFAALGQLMAQSHASLRDDYDVSCAELDAMVAIVSKIDGVYGARMTGGGFGGCVVAIAAADAVGDGSGMRHTIEREYCAQVGRRPDVWLCAAGSGVAEWT